MVAEEVLPMSAHHACENTDASHQADSSPHRHISASVSRASLNSRASFNSSASSINSAVGGKPRRKNYIRPSFASLFSSSSRGQLHMSADAAGEEDLRVAKKVIMRLEEEVEDLTLLNNSLLKDAVELSERAVATGEAAAGSTPREIVLKNQLNALQHEFDKLSRSSSRTQSNLESELSESKQALAMLRLASRANGTNNNTDGQTSRCSCTVS